MGVRRKPSGVLGRRPQWERHPFPSTPWRRAAGDAARAQTDSARPSPPAGADPVPRHASAHVPRHARSPRRRWPKILAITLAVLVLVAGATVGGTLLWVRNQLASIPTFPSGPGPVAGGQPASSQPRLTLP